MDQSAQMLAQAQALLQARRPEEAERVYRRLLQNTHVIDFEYDDWLRGIAACYHNLGRRREGAAVWIYLQQLDRAGELLDAKSHVLDVARVRELEARKAGGDAARRLYREAAQGYGDAGHHVLSAIASAQAGDTPRERRTWERVLRDPRLRGKSYELALVHFNLGSAAGREGDKEAKARHLVQSQRLLEEVADEFESRGERERAFDCYAILLQLGKDAGSYENLAEGYLNCIRVLKDDNLKFYVLQYYEDFLRISLEREEFHAAATLCREAADYARRVGLIYDRSYLKRAAETWLKAAERNERDGGPIEMTENAYLAAVDAFNAVGDFFHVREVYRLLAKLPLGEKKQRRYASVVTRYTDVWQEAIESAPFPEYLRQQHVYPEIWHLDLIEWELDGDYAQVCAAILGDNRYADMIRRRALNVLLQHYDASPGGEPETAQPALLAQIAVGMGELQSYPALRPLERLYQHVHPDVRRGVMLALRHLYFKRSFQLIARGLRDESAEVRRAALESMAALHFPHAFDPLTRLFREHDELQVKETALESLGRIASLEAGEFLIEVLRYEVEPLREVARRLLAQFDNPDIFPILKKHVEMESGPLRQTLEQVVRSVAMRAPGA